MEVRFCEVDMHGHVHNSVYLTYFEMAVTKFMKHYRLFDPSLYSGNEAVFYIKNVQISYHSPLRFQDIFKIFLQIKSVGKTSIVFQGVFKKGKVEIANAEVCWVNIDQKSKTKVQFSKEFYDYISNIKIGEKNAY